MKAPEYWGSLSDHLDDLRQTLIYSFLTIGCGFLVVLYFYQPIFQFLTASYSLQRPLLLMGPLAGLVLTFKVCFWVSLLLTCPGWCWIWLKFILPGLKAHEQALIRPLLAGSLLCLGLGILGAYQITLPVANHYLMSFNETIGENAWTLNFYLDYVLLIMVGHCVACEIGFLLLLLVHFRLLTLSMLIQFRRYAWVIAFVLGALLTPPDIVTQILMAGPLAGLYEIAILYAKWREYLVLRHAYMN
jgi:sec-independent protein translocase protein TatC